ncbi:MAG: TraB/GumN family protein [Marinilabiliaceae bacterium]|nr:TraB/GumN family protein [Marinilabiliaceae bacterium]
MIKFIITFIGIIFSTSQNFEINGQNSLLWKISGNGLNHPSYLFGTIHIICEDSYFLDSTVIHAINTSSKMVLEIDMSAPGIMQKAQMRSFNKNNHNIKDDLTPNDRQFLDSCLKASFNVGIDQMGILKPWGIMITLSITNAIGCSNTKQYETELLAIAHNKNIEIDQLETIDYQLSLFDSIPYNRQLEMLICAAREKNKSKIELQKLMKAYTNQNIEEIHKLMMEQDEMKEFSNLFFYNRNKNWIPIIESFISQQQTFIAIGAGHLGGKGGVIDLLKKEGYVVEPLVH